MELYGKSVLISDHVFKGYSLKVQKDVGTEKEWLRKGELIETINGEKYFAYTSEWGGKENNVLYCLCGYEGMPKKIKEEYFLEYTMYKHKEDYIKGDIEVVIDESAPLEERYLLASNKSLPFGADTKVRVFPSFACPVCEKAPDVLMEDGMIFTRKKVAANCQIVPQENQKKKVIEWDVLTYHQTSKTDLNITKKHNRLEVDMDTGESHLEHTQNGKKEEIGVFWIESGSSYEKQFEVFQSSSAEEEVFQDFLKMCLKMRGIHYKTLEDILSEDEKEKEATKNAGSFLRVMPFLRYPQLETMDINGWTGMPLFFQERLNQAGHSKISVMEALTGHRSKAIRTMAEKKGNLELAMLFGHLIHDPNNLKKLFIGENYKREERIPSGLINLFSEPEESIFGVWNAYSQEMLLFFRELYADEKQFVRGLLKLQRSVGNSRFSFPSLRMKKVEEPAFQIEKAGQYLKDTYNAFQAIKGIKPDYKLSFQKDLKKLHDDLARDYRRLEQENLSIPYEKERIRLYERTVDGYSFVLAKDTDELIQAGEEMDHCVGSYRNEVLNGESIIVFVYDQEKERRLCLELEGSGTHLLQAKRYGNELPEKQEALIVKKWCDLCQISIQRTDDLEVLEPNWGMATHSQ